MVHVNNYAPSICRRLVYRIIFSEEPSSLSILGLNVWFTLDSILVYTVVVF